MKGRISNFLIKSTMVASLLLMTTTGLCAENPTKAEKAKAGNVIKIKMRDLELFSTAIGQIHRYYIKSVDSKKLLENAIRGMLTGLDPHSAYLDEDTLNDLLSNTSGNFVGIGVEITPEHGLIRVVSPIDDSPAKAAGVKAGDYIAEINGEPVSEMNLKEAVTKIRGEPGSELTLTLLRKDESKPLKVTLKREKMDLRSVKSRLLEDGYAYIRISQFQENTARDVKKAISEMHKKGEIHGMIVDLRDNPGGVLDAAVDVSDLFLDGKLIHEHKNRIVYTKGRDPTSTLEASMTSGSQLEGVPLIILINEGSASASEIVAGALQDYKRALIVGKNSFGKGSVQTVLPIGDKEAVKITTALYYTPAGREIQGKGIAPDVAVEELKIEDKNTDAVIIQPLREYKLKGHIIGKNEGKPMSAEERAKLAKEDYTLYQALVILKTMKSMNMGIAKNLKQ